MKALRRLLLLALLVLAAGWFFTRPAPLSSDALDGYVGDATRGEISFAIAGCASCHAAPDGDPQLLAGGRKFASDFGTFVAPNISADVTYGIGGWSDLEIASAIITGSSPDGRHYYPVFPYASYAKAELQDVVDLIAYMRTLPASPTPSQPHAVGLPFNIRQGLGAWKALYFRDTWVLKDAQTPEIERGRYLVEALGHCAECHTSRTALGGLDTARWMAGAPNPAGEGRIPNITSGGLAWSVGEIADYLESGFTPEYDSAGGEMAAVIRNTSQLDAGDRRAIATYLKALPAVAN
ncbi:c-type cytochrome [Yoonia sediminilitoris]|uniref:Mono/diheme cytochrome c family protein n=1 Tax=Yoonia sediminilitoris TaxID=1286148 RepID=A0A2T6KS46_9RHOB|nr:cytochrome c [Yoonia sediminilitoris]PUB19378.1 mono/diheme cytochrome c family protein [Yoonia sediminilitoris]RCW99546.1 mono/diheme cytochrome c family protein [Yoonia sediminilitoris]